MTSQATSGPYSGDPVVTDFDDAVEHRRTQIPSAMVKTTYAGVLAFLILYFFRPEDYVPSLGQVPLAKIAGLITGVALVAAMFVERVRLQREGKILVMLFAWLCLAIPGSQWPGGSFDTVVNGFSKMVLITVASGCVMTTLTRLRRLMMIQTVAMLVMAAFALTQERRFGRMYGAGQMFTDPNDFALNLCIILPFCVALLLAARKFISKLFWTAAALVALLAIVSSYSRGGFLALIAAFIAFALWFGKGKRTAVLLLIGLAVPVGGVLAVAGSSSYFDRMSTITNVQEDETGSAQQRKELLIRSLELTAAHPLLGVGPGRFTEASGAWHVTHNTYTQLSSEAGIPALLFFVVLVRRSFKSLRHAMVRGTECWYVAGGLYSAMAGYVVGAFFLSTAYWLAPYLLTVYATGVANFASLDVKPARGQL